mgnify:CR=1 FL=1
MTTENVSLKLAQLEQPLNVTELTTAEIAGTGVFDVLELLYHTHPTQHNGLSLAVSHDTILAAIVAVISGNKQIEQSDWPDMMEGLFVWFEGEDFSNSKLKWIWRGQKHELVIKDFQNK